MDAFTTAGALAALYDLGLLHKVAPGVFKDDKGLDMRTALLSGLLGYGVGSHGKGDLEHQAHQQAVRAERIARSLAQELRAAYEREMQLRQVVAQQQQDLRVQEGLRAALLASRGGSNKH